VQFAKGAQDLEHLYLEHLEIVDIELAEELSKCRKLAHLELPNARIAGAQFRKISSVISIKKFFFSFFQEPDFPKMFFTSSFKSRRSS
jgi:hypothetical protein